MAELKAVDTVDTVKLNKEDLGIWAEEIFWLAQVFERIARENRGELKFNGYTESRNPQQPAQ